MPRKQLNILKIYIKEFNILPIFYAITRLSPFAKQISFLVSLRKEFQTTANDHDSAIEVSKSKKFYCNW